MPGLFRLGACEYDDMHIVALGYAEPIVTVGERLGLAGQYVPTTQIPGDESVANVDDRHPDFPPASLADPVLRRGKELPAQSLVLLTRVDAE